VNFIPYPTVFKDDDRQGVGAVNMLVDITERKTANEHQRLLSNEVDHRANNLLAVVQALVRMATPRRFRSSSDRWKAASRPWPTPMSSWRSPAGPAWTCSISCPKR
jgi:hypothetical protein